MGAAVKEFGEAVDANRNLFRVNQDFTVALSFDEQGTLTDLTVKPVSGDDGELRAADKESLMAKLNRIKPFGDFKGPVGPIVGAGSHTLIRDQYEHAIVKWWLPNVLKVDAPAVKRAKCPLPRAGRKTVMLSTRQLGQRGGRFRPLEIKGAPIRRFRSLGFDGREKALALKPIAGYVSTLEQIDSLKQ